MSNPFSTATGSTDRRPPPAQTRPEDYTTHGAPGHLQNSHRLALMKVEKKQITKKTVTEEHPAEITRQPYTAAPWEPRGINWDYHINATKNRKNTMEVCSYWVDASGFSEEFRCFEHVLRGFSGFLSPAPANSSSVWTYDWSLCP